MIFGAKKIELNRVEDNSKQDLALITQMNQELAGSLDLKETLQNALETIIKRINAQAANIFLIEKNSAKIEKPKILIIFLLLFCINLV